MNLDLENLFGKLNAPCKRALESASGMCVSRTHYEVDILHLLASLLDNNTYDFNIILQNEGIDQEKWKKKIHQELEVLRKGNPGRPVFSTRLIDCIKNAWMFSSIELKINTVRTSTILAALINDPFKFGVEHLEGLSHIDTSKIIKNFWNITQLSTEEIITNLDGNELSHNDGAKSSREYLDKYAINFTDKAKNGLIDPVFGRDKEIRQIIDVLSRRRKNNPITVGEAGVGKTSVIEGLALKIAKGDVPDAIKDSDIYGLDIGLLQAGASVKGEFEKRLNEIINEVKSSVKPIILFIDEAHTLIGAGGSAGTNDAANLLKPALARGELRTIAATTWSEYKKYIDKDPALERRFQLIKLDEPSVEQATVILRGLRSIYENSHNVYIRDDAIESVAKLSARYITGRQLPDKAVDVLDTACARVKISLTTKPDYIEDLERKIATSRRECESLQRDHDTKRSNNVERIAALSTSLTEYQSELDSITAEWHKELELVNQIIKLRKAEHLVNDKSEISDDSNSQLSDLIHELEKYQSKPDCISYEVTPSVVEKVISDWTGIPLSSMVKDDIDSVFSLSHKMKSIVRGQDQAISIIDSSIRNAKAGLNNPDQPIAVFLLVGPSGVGKTETALSISNLMFGGDRFMTTINMSEYQEKHTVSRLIGSTAGYVGYGEGGLLTEAIRQRPYSVLLLDEVEKADLEVLNLFYQVFDKGVLSDGEGRAVDFKNTVIFLTSNLASNTIMSQLDINPLTTFEEMVEIIKPELRSYFKPALLGRMTVVPYYPLNEISLKSIVEDKLQKVNKRLSAQHNISLIYKDDVVDKIYKSCTDAEAGARNVDSVINGALLPLISNKVLSLMGSNTALSDLKVDLTENLELCVDVI